MIKQFIKKNTPVLGSVVLFFLLFVYGLVKNMSMSYMGNTSRQMEAYIFDNFLGYIIVFLLKILAVYLAVGLVTGIVVHFIITSISGRFNTMLSIKAGLLLNLIFGGFIFIIFFFKDLILYPQAYMNNFYVRNDINKFLVDFLSDNVNPVFFSVIQIILAVLLAGTGLYYVYRLCYRLYKKNKNILRSGLVVFGVIAVVIIFFYAFSGSGKNDAAKPNVLILAADALRPDHFSGYGYFRDTTPNIDRLIREGVSFTNAFIEVPRTFPSWVSILTGRFASSHGIRHMFPTSRDVNRDFNSIADLLKKEGYETSVVGDYAADIFSRIGLGFDHIDVPYFNFNYLLEQIILEAHTGIFPFITNRAGLELFPVLKDSAYFCPPEFVKDRVIDRIERSRQPFFISTFFSSTHFPYASPYPYYKLYRERDYEGPYKYYKQRIISLEDNHELKISGTDIKQIRALYDGGLKAFDDAAGEILDYLSENGILDNTVVIVLSDHGENIYEHDLGMGHGEHFRGEYSTRIPFIIRYPEKFQEKAETDKLVRVVDIAPTLLSTLGLPVPEYMEGISLLPLINGKNAKETYAFGETGIWFDNIIREDLFFQKQRIMYPDITMLGEIDPYFDNQIVLKDEYRDVINLAKHRYVFDGRYKLIYMPLKDRVLYELYDTVNDPEEKNNIVMKDRKNFYRLRKILFDWIGRNNDVFIRNDYVFPVLRY